MSEKALSRIDPQGKIPTTNPIPGFKLKSANAEMPIEKWILATVKIGKNGEYEKQHKIPIVSQGREVLIGLEILNNEFDIFLTPQNKFLRTKNGKKIPLQQRTDILLSEILCQHISKENVMFQIWKAGKNGEKWLLDEIKATEIIKRNLEIKSAKLLAKKPPYVIGIGGYGLGRSAKKYYDDERKLIEADIKDQEKYLEMLHNIQESFKAKRIQEDKAEAQNQIETIRKFMEEQRQKAELKKAQLATKWESRTKTQNTQQYPVQKMMSNWYTGNFDWKNPRNQYEQTLMEMRRPQTRSRLKSRSRSRSKPRSGSKLRSRSKSRSKSRKRASTPRPKKRIHAITRSQQRRINQGINQGTRIRQSQIPTQTPGITLPTPPRIRIRTGSQGEMIGSPFNSIVISPA